MNAFKLRLSDSERRYPDLYPRVSGGFFSKTKITKRKKEKKNGEMENASILSFL